MMGEGLVAPRPKAPVLVRLAIRADALAAGLAAGAWLMVIVGFPIGRGLGYPWMLVCIGVVAWMWMTSLIIGWLYRRYPLAVLGMVLSGLMAVHVLLSVIAHVVTMAAR